MKIKQLFTYCLLASTFLLTSCDNETLPDGDGAGTPLPEGMYPLTFTATQDNSGGVQTRVSEKTDGNSQWSDGDVIGVRIGTDTQTGSYTLNADGTVKSTNTPVYWQSSGTQAVTGWYPANGNELKTKLLNQQANGFPYVLKGTGSGAYNSSASLSFTHQLAKVRIKLTGTVKGLENATVTLKGYTDFTYTEGTISDAKTEGTITPKNKNAAGYYEALLIPTGASSVPDKFVTIKVGDNIFYYTPTGEAAKLVAGQVYTYTIAVNLTPAKPITITDNGEYTITGSGKQTITISGGSPVVTFDNITIKENPTPISISGTANPTLIFKGTNEFETTGKEEVASIQIADGCNVTIKGESTSTTLTIKSRGDRKTGIGSASEGRCGDILVQDITLTMEIAGSTGIGAGFNGTCGNITIKNAILNITNCDNSAAIGVGVHFYPSVQSTCQNIKIINSDITAKTSLTQNYGVWASLIGTCASGSANTKCGTIDIYLKSGQGIDDFLNKLTTSYAPKVGNGYSDGYMYANVATTGTITWYDSSGNKIGTGSTGED